MSAGFRAFRPGVRARAFTLVELTVVVAILILLFMFSIRGVLDMSRRARLRSSAERVANTLGLARSLAISENAIHHVRAENRGPDDQWIGIYRFAKMGNALAAAQETAVWDGSTINPPGWNPTGTLAGHNFTNVVVERQKLETGTCFETIYNPQTLWDSGQARFKSVEMLHRSSGRTDLYYSGEGAATPYPLLGNSLNAVPKTTPDFQSGGTAGARLLFFYPDGTASANVFFLIRDDRSFFYVQVWRGGAVRMGELTVPADFTRQLNGP